MGKKNVLILVGVMLFACNAAIAGVADWYPLKDMTVLIGHDSINGYCAYTTAVQHDGVDVKGNTFTETCEKSGEFVYTCTVSWYVLKDGVKEEVDSAEAKITITVMAIKISQVVEYEPPIADLSTITSMKDDFAQRYLVAVRNFRKVLNQYRKKQNNVEQEPKFRQKLFTAIQDFKKTCLEIQKDIAKAIAALKVNSPKYGRGSGVFAFTVEELSGSEQLVDVTVEPKSTNWKSTASFGNELWEELKPLSFQVGTQKVTGKFNGNYGTIEVKFKLGAPFNEDRIKKIKIPEGPTEDLAIKIAYMIAINDKDAINKNISDVQRGGKVWAMASAWFPVIPVIGDAVAAGLNNTATIVEGGAIEYYELKHEKNREQGVLNITEAEELPETKPRGEEELLIDCEAEALKFKLAY